MKLYLSPGACSLADHVALHEAGLDFERVRVDLKTKRTTNGADYTAVNPKGYVPALVLDDGQVLTENVAILTWIADRAPKLAPSGAMGRYRLLEMLAYISTELHKSLGALLFGRLEEAKADAGKAAARRLAYLAERMPGNYLFGGDFSVADAYLFVMLRWASAAKMEIPARLSAFLDRMNGRPAVQLALQHEGLKP
jgi:glutathione S-transferase